MIDHEATAATLAAGRRARHDYDRRMTALLVDELPRMAAAGNMPPVTFSNALRILRRAILAELPSSNPLDADGWPIIDWTVTR